jgi:hypothetical protein
MRIARKLTLLATLALAAGGCRLHMASAGLVSLTVHLAAGGVETMVSSCNVEFDVRIDAAAEGWISHHEFTGDAACTRLACGQANPSSEGRAWTFHMAEVEPPARTEQATILFCHQLLDGQSPTHCEVRIPLTQTSMHRYRLTASDASGHGAAFPHCELTGTFDVEAAGALSGEALVYQSVEIRHS